MARSNIAELSGGGGMPPLRQVPAASLMHVLSEVRDVVLIVSRDRAVLYGNRAAARLVARREPLQVRRGRLEAAAPEPGQELGRAIDSACASGARAVLVLHRTAAPPLVFIVECLEPGGDLILLLACDSSIQAEAVVDALRSCFRLTRSEAEVAAALAAGRSTNQIAQLRGVTVHTIRTQVKTIAGKLGCARQSEIAAIVRAVPLAGD